MNNGGIDKELKKEKKVI